MSPPCCCCGQELLRVPAGLRELNGWPQYKGRLRLDNLGRCQVRWLADVLWGTDTCCWLVAALVTPAYLVLSHSPHTTPTRSDALCVVLTQVHLNMFGYLMFWAAFYVLRGSRSADKG